MSSEIRAELENLSPERRALLARRLRERGGASPNAGARPAAEVAAWEQPLHTPPPITRARAGGGAPLSFAQQRLWFIDQLDPGRSNYNVVASVSLVGPLDEAALARSFAEIEHRHESLRTKFTSEGGRPEQSVLPPAEPQLRVVDLRGEGAEGARAAAIRLAAEETQRPFDLAAGRLYRALLVREGEESHALILTMHHIVSDGWSMGVFIREMAALYRAFSSGESPPLDELPVQYSDFARWQQSWLQGEILEAQLDYWKKQLTGAPPAVELLTDRPRQPAQSFRGARERLTLSARASEALKALARREGASIFMVLLAGFKALLSRYSGQADIVVGTPIANRSRSEVEGLIGFFANTLVLRTELSGDPTFRELLGRVRRSALGGYAHQDLPFERLVEELNPERDASRHPLFQVMFVLQNTQQSTLQAAGMRFEPFPVEGVTSKFDLTLIMEDSGAEIGGSLEYSTDLFDASTAARMLEHLRNLFEGAAADPDRRVSELPLAGEAERRLLLRAWNDTARDYGTPRVVHRLFESQAAATPAATAAVHGGEALTYAELNAKANRLAHRLRSLGVRAESRVGICIERSFDMLAAVLAVLKAGGAYVPLDPEYPAERLVYMLEDSGAGLLLTSDALAPRLHASGARVLALGAEWQAVEQESAEDLDSGVDGDNLCYVIYTSGSTGRPKGVAMTHRALANLIEWQHEELNDAGATTTLQFSSLSFDVSFHEMFSAWRSGGTLVLIPEEARRDPALLAGVMARHGVDRLLPSFAALQQLAEHADAGGLAGVGLREVKSTAEQLHVTPQIVRLFRGMSGGVLRNDYGPSETHAVTSYTLAGPPEMWPALPPIGRPIANTQIYLLDRNLRPAPLGVAGELYVGGECLARGYLGRPDLTAEKFVPDPHGLAPGGRLYKTGDLARYLPGGEIEFLGRIDHQVKIRGFRVELGEVEAALAQHPRVREAAAAVRGKTPSERTLVAYVVAEGDEAPAVEELRAFLKDRLPEYMVPTAFVALDSLPLTPSGKIDRKALPEPDGSRLELGGEFRAPSTPAEEIVAGIWAQVLRLERVGVSDNFFDLGGHSLLATQLMSRLRESFQVELPLRVLFEGPTVEGLIDALAREWGGREVVEEIAATVQQVDALTAEEVGEMLKG
ncbi:MAG TPA: amino acid adenylation domain-containing protein [Pyrinomonadaceae bacterium]